MNQTFNGYLTLDLERNKSSTPSAYRSSTLKRSSTLLFKRSRPSTKKNSDFCYPQNTLETKQKHHAKLFAKLILFDTHDNLKNLDSLCYWYRFYTKPEYLLSALLELLEKPHCTPPRETNTTLTRKTANRKQSTPKKLKTENKDQPTTDDIFNGILTGLENLANEITRADFKADKNKPTPLPRKTKPRLISRETLEDNFSSRESGYLSSTNGDSPHARGPSSISSNSLHSVASETTPVPTLQRNKASSSSSLSSNDSSFPESLRRILEFLNIWANSCASDLSKISSKTKETLLDLTKNNTDFTTELRQLLLEISDHEIMTQKAIRKIIKVDLQNTAKDALIKNGWWQKPAETKKRTIIEANYISPETMARRLTDIEMEYLALCDPGMLMSCLTATTSGSLDSLDTTPDVSDQEDAYPVVQCYDNYFTRLINLVSSDILLSPNVKLAAKVAGYWLCTFQACQMYGNFNSCIAIGLGLQQESIIRLKKKIFTCKNALEIFERIKSFTSPMNNFQVYREEISKFKAMNENLHIIPFFTLLKKDLLACKQQAKMMMARFNDVCTFDEISGRVREFKVLQENIYKEITHERNGFQNSLHRLLEEQFALAGGVFSEKKAMYFSFLLESAKGTFEKNEYKSLKNTYCKK